MKMIREHTLGSSGHYYTLSDGFVKQAIKNVILSLKVRLNALSIRYDPHTPAPHLVPSKSAPYHPGTFIGLHPVFNGHAS